MIANLVEERDVPEILAQLYKLIDDAIKESKLVKVAHHSGTIFAVPLLENSKGLLEHEYAPKHKNIAVQALALIQMKINDFNLYNRVSMKTGLGLSFGTVHIGFMV